MKLYKPHKLYRPQKTFKAAEIWLQDQEEQDFFWIVTDVENGIHPDQSILHLSEVQDTVV